MRERSRDQNPGATSIDPLSLLKAIDSQLENEPVVSRREYEKLVELLHQAGFSVPEGTNLATFVSKAIGEHHHPTNHDLTQTRGPQFETGITPRTTDLRSEPPFRRFLAQEPVIAALHEELTKRGRRPFSLDCMDDLVGIHLEFNVVAERRNDPFEKKSLAFFRDVDGSVLAALLTIHKASGKGSKAALSPISGRARESDSLTRNMGVGLTVVDPGTGSDIYHLSTTPVVPYDWLRSLSLPVAIAHSVEPLAENGPSVSFSGKAILTRYLSRLPAEQTEQIRHDLLARADKDYRAFERKSRLDHPNILPAVIGGRTVPLSWLPCDPTMVEVLDSLDAGKGLLEMFTDRPCESVRDQLMSSQHWDERLQSVRIKAAGFRGASRSN